MKYVLILALAFAVSCTTKKKEEPKVESAGESDSTQVSPYTVQPCYCMKIFKPVCAAGTNYGNSCEAECHGHKTWTEGSCGAPKK